MLRKNYHRSSLLTCNDLMPWPSLRPMLSHLLLAQHHLEVPSLHCCPGSLSLLGNPADINFKTQMKVWILPTVLFLFDISLQLQGHQQFEPGGLQQEHCSLKVYVSTSSSHEHNVKSVSRMSHLHIISYYCLSYHQASKAEFCQQIAMWFLDVALDPSLHA